MPSITKFRLAYLEKKAEVLDRLTRRSLYSGFQTITKDEFYELLGDRYTIFYREHFEKGGWFPQYYVDEFVRTFQSDTRSHKSTIFGNDGSPIKKPLEGIMCHDVLEDVMKKFMLQEHITHAYSEWNGRNKIHMYLMEKCWEHIDDYQKGLPSSVHHYIEKPTPGKLYSLTGGKDKPSIANGNSWSESEVTDG